MLVKRKADGVEFCVEEDFFLGTKKNANEKEFELISTEGVNDNGGLQGQSMQENIEEGKELLIEVKPKRTKKGQE